MFSLYKDGTTQTDFVVSLDSVAHWLGITKSNLHVTLKASYTLGIDYSVNLTTNPRITGKYGRNSYKHILLTPDCFKRLCMRSRGKRAEDVRTYFIQLEALVVKYKDQMMQGMREEIDRLEKTRRPSALGSAASPGYIYVIRASASKDSVFKVGRTVDLRRRLRDHGSSRDDMEVVYTYRTENVNEVEGCLKSWLKPKQYRKYKEVYQVDIGIIKQLIDGCDGLSGMLKKAPLRTGHRASSQAGGYYYAVCMKDA